MLAEFGQTLHRALLAGQAGGLDSLGLEPVEVVGKVDHRVGTGLVQQHGEAGGVPSLVGRSGGEEADVFLGAQADQRLSKGITATQQHQAHAHILGVTRIRGLPAARGRRG